MGDYKVPKRNKRTRSDFLRDYREFDMEVEYCFYGSYKQSVSKVLHSNGIVCPGVAYYCEEMRIIDDAQAFPGSPLFFAKLLAWAFETKRAYEDAYHSTGDCSDLEAALYVCVTEFDDFVASVMKRA